jgi:tRNA(Ile)-lysidine synthase TilS/MesJ
MNDYEEGFLMGLLVGEGYFGGDKIRAQVNIKMHVRHQKLLVWCLRMIPGSKLYGPYHHCGRHYLQWMARGKALRQVLLPILLRNFHSFDDHIKYRISRMIEEYHLCEQRLVESLLLEEKDVP